MRDVIFNKPCRSSVPSAMLKYVEGVFVGNNVGTADTGFKFPFELYFNLLCSLMPGIMWRVTFPEQDKAVTSRFVHLVIMISSWDRMVPFFKC